MQPAYINPDEQTPLHLQHGQNPNRVYQVQDQIILESYERSRKIRLIAVSLGTLLLLVSIAVFVSLNFHRAPPSDAPSVCLGRDKMSCDEKTLCKYCSSSLTCVRLQEECSVCSQRFCAKSCGDEKGCAWCASSFVCLDNGKYCQGNSTSVQIEPTNQQPLVKK
eukprot:TRINITY_DN15135_c0_g1_i1.p1 TRINITY_DN15135_c0_g1~~TRINITY_DN15135_c0_g1_i1.p1  ORF type:complete len:164 (+),score=37.61 TRINITY_DN15135_c0_g1_i1:125-616(+)